MEHLVSDDQTENGVAEELEAFIRRAGVLGAPAAMGEGAREQSWIGERVAEPLGERSEEGRADQLWPSRPKT